MHDPVLERLNRQECFRLLASVPIGRVGLSISALPVVLPVRFALLDDDVVFRTATGTRLYEAATEAVLAFEADQHDPEGVGGWSVLVQGRSEELTDATTLARARALGVLPWTRDDAADRFIRITSTVVTGRRCAP
jgi:nitroimidazol reductase NimA-like FMN-containing flavoprotein (pyridoxamine 5'-phosphate oxidase superfamily)